MLHKNSSEDERKDKTQASFINLPRELRDLIYIHLLNEERRAPDNPDCAGERDPSWNTPCTIYFEAHSPKPALLQLKLCAKQLHSEVSDTLTKHIKAPTGPAHLDIMVKGSCIWPTWIALPVTPDLDLTIRINLRLFEAKGWGSEFSTGAYRGLWSLFNLLVFRGPCFTHNTTGLSSPLRIGRLRFEIMLCFPTSVDDLFGTSRDVYDRLEKLANDNVGMGNVETIEACMGPDRRVWELKQLPTGLTFASRV